MSYRILIADDDFELTEALAWRCRQLGLAVETAASSMEALRKLEQRPPDVVILDVEMPEGSGLAVCEMMLNHEHLKKIPVVVLTGRKDPKTFQRCLELRAFYVSKCSNVWPRVGPLLQELLDLPDPESTGEATASASLEPFAAPPKPDPEEIIDAVFAALAYDGASLHEDGLEATLASHIRPSRPWVLCIDDDSAFSLGLQMRLEDHGVDVLRAFDGRAGYRYAFTSPAQAILLDYELPQGNGDYVLRRLKESPATRDIPVIVLTGRRDASVERQMYSLGAAAFVSKPYDWSELWQALKQHLHFEDPASGPAPPHAAEPQREARLSIAACD